MKAAICTKYGPPEVVRVQEVAKPVQKSNEILVRVMASAVNSGDVRVRGLVVSGWMKVVMRLVLGISRPRKPILGTVFSGVVEAIGSKVTRFKTGDRVFGMTGFKFGGHAEYMAVRHDAAVLEMPSNASFEEAAALPFGGQTAIYFLDKAGISTMVAPKLLVIGATGAVGTAAIQIAKHYQADITAICSARGEGLVGSLGVDKIFLYDKQDVSQLTGSYDIIFDAVGKTTSKECKHLLGQDGVYKSVNRGYAAETMEQLKLLKQLFEQGQYKAVIDKLFTLDEIVAAHAYVDSGRKKGNVVVRIG